MNKTRSKLQNIAVNLRARAAIIEALRRHFRDQGFLEVETPSRLPFPAPERHIDLEPSGDWFLMASPELQMKRLVAAGFDKVFQLCRCFRAGEQGARHQPEFTMLEWYRQGADLDGLMSDCEQLVSACAAAVGQRDSLKYQAARIDLRTPWPRLEVRDAFERFASWRPGAHPDPDRFDLDMVDKVEPNLPVDRPVFLFHYPAAMASLARLHPGDPAVAERVELYIGGLELGNGFVELVDASEQRTRFLEETAYRKKLGKPSWPLDEKFLAALENGLPPCAGLALGVDRLVMLLCDAATIDEVIAFPVSEL
ncbi:MAG: EF-P lysine aminoacylase EpmA [Myxococcota bacterium]|nr:EF-P lysine aminoacylase EpmA [Myxococcota bacterium]